MGYICGFITSKKLKTHLNIPLILLLSVIPDIDLLIPQLQHRGPTHSIIAATVFFIPFFVAYHERAIPYFTALTQHFLIGDLIMGGRVQLFWPITTQGYGMEIGIRSPINITTESVLFIIAIAIMLKTREISVLFKPLPSNLLLVIPLPSAFLPTFMNYPLNVPIWLMPPHLFYVFLFLASILLYLFKSSKSVIHRVLHQK